MYGLWLRVPRPTQDQVVAAFNSNVAPLRTHFVDEGSLALFVMPIACGISHSAHDGVHLYIHNR